MRCPYCSHEIHESWNSLFKYHGNDGKILLQPVRELEDTDGYSFRLDWMNCPNSDCRKLIIKGSARRVQGGIPESRPTASGILLPRRSVRPVDPTVASERPEYAKDYQEAVAILEDSPKASAALSRRVLADLLSDYGGYTKFNLSSRIDDFINDKANPSSLKDNLHYLREIADFAAHTQKDDLTGIIIDVEPGEAEWCLNVIDRLFDYYIIGPAKDKEMRRAFDEKLDRTNRKPIKPVQADEKS